MTLGKLEENNKICLSEIGQYMFRLSPIQRNNIYIINAESMTLGNLKEISQ